MCTNSSLYSTPIRAFVKVGAPNGSRQDVHVRGHFRAYRMYDLPCGRHRKVTSIPSMNPFPSHGLCPVFVRETHGRALSIARLPPDSVFRSCVKRSYRKISHHQYLRSIFVAHCVYFTAFPYNLSYGEWLSNPSEIEVTDLRSQRPTLGVQNATSAQVMV